MVQAEGVSVKDSNVQAKSTKVAIIFDAYNTLITVDKDGNFAPHFNALASLQALK